MKTVIEWIEPAKEAPPFMTKILVLLGSQTRALDGKWQNRATLREVSIRHASPNDDNLFDEFNAYESGEGSWADYQFEMYDGDEEDDLDWYTDAILMWAHAPDFAATLGLNK